ncbi:MAG: phosphotransferase [Anaerolineae bacterium]|nr:phosphotransferase [Anaerolineae bacterium]
MDDRLITQAARHFGTVPSALTPLPGGHVTAVYEFARGPERCILRIIPPGADTTPEDVRAIQAWVTHLANHGAPVPAPADRGLFSKVTPRAHTHTTQA